MFITCRPNFKTVNKTRFFAQPTQYTYFLVQFLVRQIFPSFHFWKSQNEYKKLYIFKVTRSCIDRSTTRSLVATPLCICYDVLTKNRQIMSLLHRNYYFQRTVLQGRLVVSPSSFASSCRRSSSRHCFSLIYKNGNSIRRPFFLFFFTLRQ